MISVELESLVIVSIEDTFFCHLYIFNPLTPNFVVTVIVTRKWCKHVWDTTTVQYKASLKE